MFKKIRKSIEEHRSSNEFKWKFLVFLKDFGWAFCAPIEVIYSFKRNLLLKKLIKDKRILIVGSGPSAEKLGEIPNDVRVFTCKSGLRLFVDKNFERQIDLYLAYKSAMERSYEFLREFLQKTKTKIFMIDDLGYIKEKKELEGFYLKLLWDTGRNNYYLERLIKPYKIRQIKGKSLPRTSSGIRLLQYALFFGAREIYLIGIDISEKGYFWGTKNAHFHLDIDRNFIKIVSKKYNNIYSLSKKSPITKYIKYKNLR